MSHRISIAAIALLLIASLVFSSGCESSGGGGGGTPIPAFQLVITSFPTSLFVSTPFDVTLERRDTSTGLPANVAANTNVTVTNSGGGTLGGTTTRSMAAGTATVTFNSLTLSATGAVTLTFTIAEPGTQGANRSDTVTLTLVNLPGPLAQLKSGRVNAPYVETVGGFVTGASAYSIAGGSSLPAGLALNGTSGDLTGSPSTTGMHNFTVYATTGPGTAVPIRCTLPIFSANDTEWVAGQNFGTGVAPYTGTNLNEAVNVTSTFDGASINFSIRIFYPSQIATIGTPMPLLILHHGRGFDHTNYNDILTRVAAWGFVIVSSGDYYSFLGSSQPGYSGPQPYEFSFAEQGMESASGTQEALVRHMLIRNRTTADTFFGKINEDRIFISGHSRGGGATHGSHTRGLDFVAASNGSEIPITERYAIAGVIYLMPFDLWFFTSCQPPSTPSGPGPGYSIPRDNNRIPALIIASEEDGDLVYPYCDQLQERRVAATTFITIWGGNHNFTGDSSSTDGSPSITRATQHTILVQWLTAFLLRFGYDQLDLEGHLFGDEYDQSTQVGHVSWRDLGNRLVVDDAQNGAVGTNTLGLANTATGCTTTLQNPYPAQGGHPNAQIRGINISWSSTGTSSYQTVVGSVGSPRDVSSHRRLIFEIRQDGTTGFNFATIDVRLTDTAGGNTAVRVYNRSGPSSSYLPVYPIAGHSSARPLDRWVKVEIPLTSFGGVNLSSLANIRFEFDINSTTRDIMLDDIRFE